jgi:hypothetical protein
VNILEQVIPWLLSANTLTLTYLVGNKSNTGWLLGVIGQAMWFLFIFTWQVWGLLPLAVGLTILYARNLVKWHREKNEEVKA